MTHHFLMTETVSRLFQKAVSGDGIQQLEFVKGIPMLLSMFPPDWVSTHLVQFLTLWLPLSNDPLINATLSNLSLVLMSIGAISPLAPLAELLLSSDNSNSTRVFIELVTSSLFDNTLTAFVTRLSDSLYDPARAFVPQVVYLLPSDSAKMQIFEKALVDRSFKVRSACARSISDLSDSLARHVASFLQCDPHPRVRATVPAVAACRPFFLDILNTHPILASDADWSVRAAVASGLTQSPAPHGALVVLARLISDAVWQVNYVRTGRLRHCLRELTSTWRCRTSEPSAKCFLIIWLCRRQSSRMQWLTCSLRFTSEARSLRILPL
jgi:hypothetical protein